MLGCVFASRSTQPSENYEKILTRENYEKILTREYFSPNSFINVEL